MEKLRIYRDSLKLVGEVYKLTRKNLRLKKDYSLCDQIRRAAISISANIAEGYMRSVKQFRNYLKIASGSSNEVVSLLQIISLIYEVDTADLQGSFKLLGRQINSFSNKLNKY